MSKIQEWLGETSFKNYTIESALADASFRKYYRLRNGDKTAILMDSSKELNSMKAFIEITLKLHASDVCAPKLFEQNQEDGYLILEDFGTTHYLDILNEQNYKAFYTKAINTILKMQKIDASSLPKYDKDFLHFEMDLMQEWYLENLLQLKMSEPQKKLIKKTLDAISTVVLEQPQGIFVHRDFHSRNIMLKSDKKIGIIDYQDAMSGALTYDLASLLKDCYVAYDRKEIKKLALEFRDKKGLKVDDETFVKWFDFMGMQRHIKVLGVFSRLSIRDKKDGYLKDIPLTLKYLIDTALRYEQTKEFASFLNSLK
ncbi:MAG TPA: phosphotransferase [Sulfurimonas sp.]|jgi:N-acetylmuramate 1-kinase|uniref:aminoglycoside phosphotransferase family protein n=1 Tax=Sulfurimonas sp. TaxID=2022749 RepID=UPI002B8F9095|nr:phosphotransferase [Sulfurimonas sp.]HUH42984.1 phosphotransferase [Sulfurimonas sp.]